LITQYDCNVRESRLVKGSETVSMKERALAH
jgi:hypothetical protein